MAQGAGRGSKSATIQSGFLTVLFRTAVRVDFLRLAEVMARVLHSLTPRNALWEFRGRSPEFPPKPVLKVRHVLQVRGSANIPENECEKDSSAMISSLNGNDVMLLILRSAFTSAGAALGGPDRSPSWRVRVQAFGPEQVRKPLSFTSCPSDCENADAGRVGSIRTDS